MCLEINDGLWYLDSGCSKHKTGQESQFRSLKLKEGGEVAFGGDEKEKIIRLDDIGNSTSNCIENVLLVKGLKHNLLSISQLCGKSYKVTFEVIHYVIIVVKKVTIL